MNFKSKEFGVIQSPVIVVRIGKIVGCGLEDIRYQLLKHLPESSLHAVLDLMNGIWEAGDVPSIWKLANVIPIPIPKPGKYHSEPSHYRPIALTNCVCKTMERRINARLCFLESNGILSNIQCGFWQGRDTLDHLVRFETIIWSTFALLQSNNNHIIYFFSVIFYFSFYS